MDLNEFRQRCSNWSMDYPTALQLLTRPYCHFEHCFHVQLKSTEFTEFCDSLDRDRNVRVVIASELWKDHVHLICYHMTHATHEIRHFDQLREILIRFFFFRNVHDFFCYGPVITTTTTTTTTSTTIRSPSCYPYYCVSFDYFPETGRCRACHRTVARWKRHVSEGRCDESPSVTRWCRECRKVPLYEILTLAEWRELYGGGGDEERPGLLLRLEYLPDGAIWKRSSSSSEKESLEEFLLKYDKDTTTATTSREWFRGTDNLEEEESEENRLDFQFAGYVSKNREYQRHLMKNLVLGY